MAGKNINQNTQKRLQVDLADLYSIVRDAGFIPGGEKTVRRKPAGHSLEKNQSRTASCDCV